MHHLVIVMLLVALTSLGGCAGDSGDPALAAGPTSPTPTATSPTLALSSIASVPDGAGVQYSTDFQFTATGTFPGGTQYVWRFGDGSSVTTSSASVSKIFGQAGVFDVSVEARADGASASAVRPVSVRSLIGRWTGTVTGFTSFPSARPVPITGFELSIIDQTVAADGSLMLRGRWADNAGCRETRVEYLRQTFRPEPAATVTFGVNGLSCASGDFYLTGIADAKFDRVEGHCNGAGNNPNCRFAMVRE
jgi:hypothetical protein